MARILDAQIAFLGSEPKFSTELTESQLLKTLNWYSQNRENKDAYKYACDYFKKKFKIDASESIKQHPTTLGWLCRIVSNGATFNTKNKLKFDQMLEKIKKESVKPVIEEKKETVSIQQRLTEKVMEITGEIDGLVDDYILSGFKTLPSPYALMQGKVKGLHAKRIIEIYKDVRSEFDNALTSDDEQIKEAYSCFTKSQLKKLVACCDLVITDAMKLAGESEKTRKPRKRKQKSPEQLVAKMKYCNKFVDLKLTSIAPCDIIGVNQLWIYNIKKRKLGCYVADDASGLTVKGSTILNFSENKSIEKTLRKPEDILTEVVEGGKVFLRNVLGNIRAVEKTLTGRINKDTILLRVVK